MQPSTAPLLVFADDWGRHPSSCQHLIRRLLPQRRVAWVNTIGTRKPRLDLATLKRGWEKLRHWSHPAAAGALLPVNLSVHNPRMWPGFSRSWSRRFNQVLLTRAVRRIVSGLSEPPIVVTTLPLTADLVGRLPVRRWIYYCVDDFSLWPGLDGATLRQMETDLVRRVDRAISVSEVLQRRLREMGRESTRITHGVDVEFWQSDAGTVAPGDWPRPWLVFWGVVDRRMDVAMVRRLSNEHLGSIILVGPHNDPDPALLELPGVYAPGPLQFETLPALAGHASVLLMPYADLPVTRAMQPLKLKEYLATGLPVVARDLPANREWGDCLDLFSTDDEFLAAVRRRLVDGVSREQQNARRRLDSESWAAKAVRFAEVLDA